MTLSFCAAPQRVFFGSNIDDLGAARKKAKEDTERHRRQTDAETQRAEAERNATRAKPKIKQLLNRTFVEDTVKGKTFQITGWDLLKQLSETPTFEYPRDRWGHRYANSDGHVVENLRRVLEPFTKAEQETIEDELIRPLVAYGLLRRDTHEGEGTFSLCDGYIPAWPEFTYHLQPLGRWKLDLETRRFKSEQGWTG